MFGCLLVVLACYGGYCFGLGRGSVPGNTAGIADVERQLTSAQETATGITDRAVAAQQGAQTIGKNIDRITSIVSESRDSIENCERIIEGIRARGKVEIK